MLKMIKRWLARNKARAQLNAMSSRELKDIGITRSEIERAIRESGW